MNKKRLSVVMAGAMLASSVAPVLAAEVQKSEVSVSDKGLLITELTDFIWGKNFTDDERTAKALRGKLVYSLEVDSKPVTLNAETKGALQESIKTGLASLTEGQKITVSTVGFREIKEEDGTISYASREEGEFKTYKPEDLADNGPVMTEFKAAYDAVTTATNINTVIAAKTSIAHVDGKLEITLAGKATGLDNTQKLTINVGDKALDFTKFIDLSSDNNAAVSFNDKAASLTNFGGFPEAAKQVGADIKSSVVREIKITSGGTSYKLSDLYDGVMLTEKGQALLALTKDADATGTKLDKSNAAKAIQIFDLNSSTSTTDVSGSKAGDAITGLKKDKDGNYKVAIKILNSFRATADFEQAGSLATQFDTYTITSDNERYLNRVLSWLDGAHANVDVLAGEDRYETAVKISKEVARLNNLASNSSAKEVNNIVLVNGDSLVDGLAAAPLAAKLANDGHQGNAPILLTEKNSLPRATKTYLKELLDETKNRTITVSIVGGDGVVSDSIVRELKDMNLRVQRFGGADREATSMAVAEEVGFDNGAFVVGATGEADAMSVSGKAAEMKAPIIVSGFEGLSDDTINALYNEEVTVIGGDSAVSEADFNELKSVADKTRRIFGSDRKATNAAVINNLYGSLGTTTADDTESVIVAKDDVLIDALTSANLSAVQNAPIVLGTNSLSNEQINAIVANAKKAKNVYQVGGNVAQSVVRTVAVSLGLAD